MHTTTIVEDENLKNWILEQVEWVHSKFESLEVNGTMESENVVDWEEIKLCH